MINMYTVATAPVFPYAKVFFGSLYANVDLSNINKILVLDAGLHENQRQWLMQRYQKIEFIDSGQKLISRKHKDKPWGQTVSLKTKTLEKSFAADHSLPYLMMDLDSFFLDDFYDDLNLDEDFDVGLCRRLKPLGINGTGPNGCAYIGSFFIANNKYPKKAKAFMNRWMDMMKLGGRLKETPSLCRLISGYRIGWQRQEDFKPEPLTGFKVKEYKEEVFACYKGYDPERAKILHFKSFGGTAAFNNPNSYRKRFGRIGGFGSTPEGRTRVLEFLEDGKECRWPMSREEEPSMPYLERHCASPDFSEV